MPNTPNKPLRSKRGGVSARMSNDRLKDIHSRLDGKPNFDKTGYAHPLHGTSNTALIGDRSSVFYAEAAIEETTETHIIPRRSLTAQQMLGIKPQKLEFAPIPTKQTLKRAIRDSRQNVVVPAGTVVTTEENRVTWRSDRTLLRRGNPFDKFAKVKREGRIVAGANSRKYIDGQDYDNAHDSRKMESVLGPAIDDMDSLFPSDE